MYLFVLVVVELRAEVVVVVVVVVVELGAEVVVVVFFFNSELWMLTFFLFLLN